MPGTAVSAPVALHYFYRFASGHAYIRGNVEMRERGEVWSHEAMLADSTLEGQRPLLAGTVTIPSVLKEAGYTTGCIGKWGLGYPGSEGTPNKMGLTSFMGIIANARRILITHHSFTEMR